MSNSDTGNTSSSEAGRAAEGEGPGQVEPEIRRAPSQLFTLHELWLSLLEYKTLTLSIVFFVTLATIVVSLLMRPVYRAEILLAPAGSDSAQGGLSALAGQFGGLAALAGIDMGGAGRNANEAIAILQSRGFTENFIRSENLMPILFEKKWDAVNGEWDAKSEDEIPTIEDAYLLFNESVRRVNLNLKTGLIRVSIDWYDRELAAQWANLMIDKLNKHIRQKDIEIAERSIEFLNAELQKNSVLGLKQGIFSLVEHQIETIMLANVQEEYAFKILDAATVPDSDNRVRPRRKVMVIVAFSFAWFLAVFIVLLRKSWKNIALD